jgi:hypothetical protein
LSEFHFQIDAAGREGMRILRRAGKFGLLGRGMVVQRSIPEYVKRTTAFRGASHALHFVCREKGVAAGLDEALRVTVFDGEAALDEDNPFIRTMPVRGETWPAG